VSAEAALAICKAEWAEARLRYSGLPVNLATQKLFDATEEFLASDYALDAFTSGWTVEQLFGMGRDDSGAQCGIICVAAQNDIEIVRFDGPRVWIKVKASGDDDGPLSFQREHFAHTKIPPWWSDPDHAPLLN
jgi:hypothetical protein